MAELKQLEQVLGHSFADGSLLERALTHPSHSGGAEDFNYQRLEFLGDAVLGLVLAEQLFRLLPDEREGVLTRYRAMLARGGQLSELAREIELGSYLRLGAAEEANGGRLRDSILEDALEALIGALYLDAGLAAAEAMVLRLFGDVRGRLDKQLGHHNPKGRLQELLQPELGNDAIEYRIVETEGPDHAKTFKVEVFVSGEALGSGSGASKKTAEEAAARVALESVAARAGSA